MKFLDDSGLSYFWAKLKEIFVTQAEVDETLDEAKEAANTSLEASNKAVEAADKAESIIEDISDEISSINDSLDEKLNISGGTMTGAITLAHGDGNGIIMPTDSNINVAGTTHTVLGFASDTYVIGHGNYPVSIRGSSALLSGAPTLRFDYSNANLKLSNVQANTDYAVIEVYDKANPNNKARNLMLQPSNGYVNIASSTPQTTYNLNVNGKTNSVQLYENGVRVATQNDLENYISSQSMDSFPTSGSNNPVTSSGIASFVNSSIATNTAYFRGTFNSVAALNAYSGTKTNNDYAFVVIYDEIATTEVKQYDRYKYDGSQWVYEYTLNNSSFTAAQWSAINSGISGTNVSNYNAHLSNTSNPHNVTKSQVGLGNVDNTSDVNKPISTAVQTALDGKLDKLTYEWSKLINFGSTGKLLIGKFPCYDTNITIDIDSSTNTTYHATLIIATQNINTTHGGSITPVVYGDAPDTITPNIKIEYQTGSNVISVYFSPTSWSKNLIHIRAAGLSSNATNICENVASIPSTATITPTNALKSNFASSSTATSSANGLMSSSDKSKLDGIASGATANTGTITGIKMNGETKGTSGVVDLGTVITSHQTLPTSLPANGGNADTIDGYHIRTASEGDTGLAGYITFII